MSARVEDCGWLRRNRWWLLALPVALALALASAAYRINDLWFENGWHRVDATVEQGRFVTTRATVYSFDEKPTPADLRVRRYGARECKHHRARENGAGDTGCERDGETGEPCERAARERAD